MNSEWQPIFDETSQTYYYWNTRTQETTWEVPPNLVSTSHTSPTTAIKTREDETFVPDEEDESHVTTLGLESAKSRSEQEGDLNTEIVRTVDGESENASGDDDNEEREEVSQKTSSKSLEMPNEFEPMTYPSQVPHRSTEMASSHPSHRVKSERSARHATIAAQQFSAILDRIDASRDTLSPGESSPDTSVRAGSMQTTSIRGTSAEGYPPHRVMNTIPHYADYSVAGGFNVLSGRFQTDPSKGYAEYDRSKRQMNAFFNYDAYVAEINAAGGRKNYIGQRKLTKKDVESLKIQKKEKKEKAKRRWLENI
jgi:hypothetical protein